MQSLSSRRQGLMVSAFTPMVSAFNAQVREDILFSGDIAALRAMELYPTYYI